MNAKISYRHFCQIASLALLISSCCLSVQAAIPYACQRTPAAKIIDGLLIDWNEPFDNITSWNWRHTADKNAIYGGEDDFSATLRFAWDDEQLYFAISIIDDYHIGRRNPQDGDSLILTIAPADSKSVTPVEIAICEAGGLASAYFRNESGDWQEEPTVKVGMTISNHFLPPTPYPCEKEKQLSTVIRDTIYEIALPWKLYPFINTTDNKDFGALLQLQDVDEKAVRGYMRWRGIRDAALTESGFGKIVLVTATD